MLEDTLRRIARLLDSGGVPYMLLGGFALAAHGIPRMTRDLDLALGVDVDQLPGVLGLLQQDFKAIVQDPTAFAKDTNVLLLQDISNGVRVDLLFTFIEFEREAIAHAETMEMDGQPVKVVSLDNLIVYKILAGRERDKEDVKAVLSQRREVLDIPRISALIEDLAVFARPMAHREWMDLLAQP